MALIDKASLLFVPSVVAEGKAFNILPSGNRAPDSTDQNSGYDQTRADFDFDRGSNAAATRVNASGLIEKYRENLFTQSNNFSDSDWTKTGVSVTGGQSGYDETTNAYKIQVLTSGAPRKIAQTGVSFSGVLTMSVYAKAGTAPIIAVEAAGSNGFYKYFNLSTGTGGSQGGSIIDSSITSIGDGWYRLLITGNPTSISSPQFFVCDVDNSTTAATGSNIYIQDAQLEKGLVATDYLDSTSVTGKAGVLVDLPRINYDANRENGALLLEPSRQNLVPISEGVPEDTNNVTLTENYGISPEGFQNSLKGQKNGVDANDRIQPIDNYNATLVSGNDYTISCFVKNIDSINGVTTLACRVSGGSLFRSGFDWDGSSLSYLTTGYNAGTRENIFVEDYGNGWWRIGFTFEADGTSGNFELDIDRRNGSNTTSIETWGWQLEAGSYVSSYIPTMGTSETRAADSFNVNSISAHINSVEGTIYLEAEALHDDNTYRGISINDGTFTNMAQIRFSNTSNQITAQYKTGGSNSCLISEVVTDTTQRQKIAFRYKANDFKMYVNGVNAGSDTSGATNSANTFDEIKSNRGDGNDVFYGRIYKYILFDEGLSNSELESLTA